jgi:hypothetical protein
MKCSMASKFLSIAALLAAPLWANARPAGASDAASSNPASGNPASSNHMTGEYMESRTADVYTGPCIANSEANLTGREAILAWHVDRGAFEGVALDGLSVVAVVRANNTLGDAYSSPLPARAELFIDEKAAEPQRAALVRFAQSQTAGLLGNVLGITAVPMIMTMGGMGSATLVAGNAVRIETRAMEPGDELCHNEDVFYPPLAANLIHSMPAVSTTSMYNGSDLGITWSETGRRGSFIGMFAN